MLCFLSTHYHNIQTITFTILTHDYYNNPPDMSTVEHTSHSDIGVPHLNFEINSLYVLLSDRGNKSHTFYWRLYLYQNTTSTYHLLNDIDPTIWSFEHLPNQTVIYDESLLGALKIGGLGPTLHSPFLERLRQIPIVDLVRFR